MSVPATVILTPDVIKRETPFWSRLVAVAELGAAQCADRDQLAGVEARCFFRRDEHQRRESPSARGFHLVLILAVPRFATPRTPLGVTSSTTAWAIRSRRAARRAAGAGAVQ